MSQMETVAVLIAGMAKAKMPIRILVCGGRKYANREKVFSILDYLVGCGEDNQLGHHCTIIHGGAKGADALAGQWAACNWKEEKVYKADWDRYGNAAGAIRNTKMLVDGNPDYVVAFPGGRGTAHMVSIAKAGGISVIEVAE